MGWLSKCRAILVRYDKNAFNYPWLDPICLRLFWFRNLTYPAIYINNVFGQFLKW